MYKQLINNQKECNKYHADSNIYFDFKTLKICVTCACKERGNTTRVGSDVSSWHGDRGYWKDHSRNNYWQRQDRKRLVTQTLRKKKSFSYVRCLAVGLLFGYKCRGEKQAAQSIGLWLEIVIAMISRWFIANWSKK